MVFLVESSGDALPDALMGSGVIVVIYEFGDEAMQLVAMENEQMVQAFPFEGADEALAMSVGLGRLKWCLQLFDATTGGKGREPSAVLAVTIANEIFGPLAPGRCFPQLLYGPRTAGRAGYGCMPDPARV